MGYGLDTTIYPGRKWGAVITWTGDEKGNLTAALDKWQDIAGVTFQKTSTGTADFEVVWGTTNQWSNDSPGNGRPETGKKGKLFLSKSAALGTVLHEVGHLLGLSHEQDHPDGRSSWYHGKPDFLLQGVIDLSAHNKEYTDYDPNSIMHYPASHYNSMTEPTTKDVDAVKELNGWS